MRRRAAEVLRVRESSPDEAETTFRELDDAFLQTQTRIWLGEVLHTRFDEEMAVADLLADGELLFQVSKVVWKMLVKINVDTKESKFNVCGRTSFAKSNGRYMPYPKIDSFLKICQILGLTGIDLFSPSDVVEKRDTRRVCMCIRSLSKKARLRNLNVPDFDIVTYTIAMPTDLVGGICRSLEQSQSSSSCSNGCSPSMDIRELIEQRSVTGCYAQYNDSFSESDEVESAYTESELWSPPSHASSLFPIVSNLFNGDSPEGNCILDENSTDLGANFQLVDHYQNQNRIASLHAGDVSAGEFMDCPLTQDGRNGEHGYTNLFCSKSFSSCVECPPQVQTDLVHIEDRVQLLSNPNTHKVIHCCDIEHHETSDSSFEDSPYTEIYKQYPIYAKEEINPGYLWWKSCGNSPSGYSTCGADVSQENAREEFKKAVYECYSHQAQNVYCSPEDDGDTGRHKCRVVPGQSLNDVVKYGLVTHERDNRHKLEGKSVDMVVLTQVSSPTCLNVHIDKAAEIASVDKFIASYDISDLSSMDNDAHDLGTNTSSHILENFAIASSGSVEEEATPFPICDINTSDLSNGVNALLAYAMTRQTQAIKKDEGSALFDLDVTADVSALETDISHPSPKVDCIGSSEPLLPTGNQQQIFSGISNYISSVGNINGISYRDSDSVMNDPSARIAHKEEGIIAQGCNIYANSRVALRIEDDHIGQNQMYVVANHETLVYTDQSPQKSNVHENAKLTPSHNLEEANMRTHTTTFSMKEKETSTNKSLEGTDQFLFHVDDCEHTGIEDCPKELATMQKPSGRNRDSHLVGKPGSKVLKLVAGGITLAGAVYLFLHMRGKRGKDNISRGVVAPATRKPSEDSITRNGADSADSNPDFPELSQRSAECRDAGQDSSTPSKYTDLGKNKVFYPGDRLKL